MSMCRWALPLLAVSAMARADAIAVTLHKRAQLGHGSPSLDVEIIERIAGFEVDLTRTDGKKLHFKESGKPGATKKIALPQGEGAQHYSGELTVNFPNGGAASLPLEFDAEVVGPLKIDIGKPDVDLEKRTLVLRLNRPAKSVHARVTMDTGLDAMDRELYFHGEDAGTPLRIVWPPSRGKVMNIALRATDTYDFYTQVELSPWQIEIPHDDILFDIGQWNIRPEEQPKLDKALQQIVEAQRHYASMPMRLFIAGHTDTVGDRESNRLLSMNRAKAIGEYFRRRGARLPIFYDGFGEEALLVATPDETAEPKNRRVEYILAIEDPTVKNATVTPQWKKL